MRQILIDYARRPAASKRGGGAEAVALEAVEAALASAPAFTEESAEALLALDKALERLRERSDRQSRIVECRFFGGMSIDETAAALGISTATVKRGWSMAQAWLYQEIQQEIA